MNEKALDEKLRILKVSQGGCLLKYIYTTSPFNPIPAVFFPKGKLVLPTHKVGAGLAPFHLDHKSPLHS